MDNLALETHFAHCVDKLRQHYSTPDRGCSCTSQGRYGNESQPLWTLPVLEEKTEIARTCSHRLMMTRNTGNSTIYSCPRCGFWLDTHLANLEDALIMWVDYVESWEQFWTVNSWK
jgi:hypothetical protein